jgi:hypothetical protein
MSWRDFIQIGQCHRAAAAQVRYIRPGLPRSTGHRGNTFTDAPRAAVCRATKPQDTAASLPARSARSWDMPALARRRYPEPTNAGMSIMATSTPARSPSASASPMTKIRGAGAAASIQVAILANAPMARRRPSMTPRADFGAAIFLPKRAEADFQGWREAQAWTAWKYKMWETGHRLPAQSTSGRARWLGQDVSPEGVDQSWLARVRAPGRPRAGHPFWVGVRDGRLLLARSEHWASCRLPLSCHTRTSHDSFDHLVDGREKPGEKTYAKRVLS